VRPRYKFDEAFIRLKETLLKSGYRVIQKGAYGDHGTAPREKGRKRNPDFKNIHGTGFSKEQRAHRLKLRMIDDKNIKKLIRRLATDPCFKGIVWLGHASEDDLDLAMGFSPKTFQRLGVSDLDFFASFGCKCGAADWNSLVKPKSGWVLASDSEVGINAVPFAGPALEYVGEFVGKTTLSEQLDDFDERMKAMAE